MVKFHYKSERTCEIRSAREQEKVSLALHFISIAGKKKVVWTIKHC